VTAWRYLDLDDPAAGAQAAGVTVAGGTIALARVPTGAQEVGAEPAPTTGSGDPAGIGIDAAGYVYLSDPAAGAVMRIDPCDGSRSRLTCGALDRPGGVAVGPRHELYVAEAGRHRVVVIDLESGQTIGYRGTPDPYGPPQPASAPGRLDTPVDVAVDGAGNLLVAERGNRRVQRFTPDGRVDPSFWAHMQATTPRPTAPAAVATGWVAGEERVLVVDSRAGERSYLLAFDTDGTLDRPLTQEVRRHASSAPALFEHPPAGVAAGGGRIYVGDAIQRRILSFDDRGRFLGTVPGYRGGAAGLELDSRGRLVVNPGGGGLVRFAGEATVVRGNVIAGPFGLPAEDDAGLAAIRATVRELPVGAQFHLAAWLAGDATKTPPPLGAPDWITGAPNAPELVLEVGGARLVWVAVQLDAGDAGGPVLGRLRVFTGLEAWIGLLPAIYARDEAARPFLARLLALLAAGLEDQEARITELPLLFDANSTPEGRLEWLARWLAFPVGDVAARERRREAVASAFRLAGQRGTAAGLLELIRLALGARAWISEPAQLAGLWRLDGTALLGFGTALAAAEAQGAVLGTTATLDRSNLIADEDFGAPLYDSFAHHFCVGVPAAELTAPGARQAIERLVERERPAHTRAHICVVEPRARVGFQARVGVDAIVAGARHATSRPRPAAVGMTRIGDRGGVR
jgi:phage tail-like protein